MSKRIDISRDVILAKNINEVDPAVSLSGVDKLLVYQGTASRSATLTDVFGQFASAADLTAFETAVTAQITDMVTTTATQTITSAKTFTIYPLVPAANPTLATQVTSKGYVDGLDGANVKLTTNQTIGGTKTFTLAPVVPTPTNSTHATSKDYVDVLDGANVKLSTNQTIAGNKTFSGNGTFNSPLSVATATSASHAVTKAQLDVVAVAVPVGSITIWPTDVAPTGYVFCRGQAISRTTFAALFALIGTTYGVGNNSTTFQVPDMADRVVAGVGSDGVLNDRITANNKVTPLSQHAHDIIIDNGGSHVHTATASNDGSHNHGFTIDTLNVTVGGTSVVGAIQATGLSGSRTVASGGVHSHTITVNSGGSHTHVGNIQNAGQPSPTMDVRQKTLYLNYIIFTGA